LLIRIESFVASDSYIGLCKSSPQTFFSHTKGGTMSIRLDYDTKLWCVVLMCTRQVVYMSISLQQCKDKYPKALLYGKE